MAQENYPAPSSPAEHRCLVPIRRAGTRLPVLVLHGMQCDASFARLLARSLPRDQPVYGFEAAGLSGQERPLKTIDEMARRYMTEAEAIVAAGRFVLVGFCAGAAIAKQIGHNASRGFGIPERLFIIDAARTTSQAGFAVVARQQAQVAKLRHQRSPRLAAKLAGSEATVNSFIKALVRYDRAGSRQTYDRPAALIATEESLSAMTDHRTGWRGILPADTPLAVAGRNRADLLSVALSKVAARVYAASAP